MIKIWKDIKRRYQNVWIEKLKKTNEENWIDKKTYRNCKG